MTQDTSRIACHECDALYRAPVLTPRETARCGRCGAVLFRAKPHGQPHALALSLAGAVCFAIANTFPLLGFSLQGRVQSCTLMTGVIELGRAGMPGLSVLVFIASIAAPALRIAGLTYVLLPLRRGVPAPGAAPIYRHLEALKPWAMIEVYMLGLLVAIVKLSQLASIIVGPALYAFIALMLCLSAADSALEPRDVWQRIQARAAA